VVTIERTTKTKAITKRGKIINMSVNIDFQENYLQKIFKVNISLALLFFMSLTFSVNLNGQMINPKALEAQAKETAIITYGHIRFCLTDQSVTKDCYNSLNIILKKCPVFFGASQRPDFFALACNRQIVDNKQKSYQALARKMLKKQKLLLLTEDKIFCEAVLNYVVKNKMIKRTSQFKKEATKLMSKLRLESEYHYCGTVCKEFQKAVTKAQQAGIILNGEVNSKTLAILNKYLPKDLKCPKTGKPDFTIYNKVEVRCKNHGTIKEATSFFCSVSDTKLNKLIKSNPFVWSFNHVIKLYASEKALSGGN